MSTLVSVFAVRFNIGEIFGASKQLEETIIGVTATITQALNNRGLSPCAVGMSEDGEIILAFERKDHAGRALYVLSAVIEVISQERRAMDDATSDNPFSKN